MPRVKLKKKPIAQTEARQSPYVIRLRDNIEALPDHESVPTVVAPSQWTNATSTSGMQPPRIDFVHGEVVTPVVSVHEGEIESRTKPQSRWRASLRESILGEWLTVAQLPRMMRGLSVLTSPVVARIPRVYGRNLATFILVAFLLVAPVGILEALDRMSTFQHVLMRGLQPLRTRVTTMIESIQQGNWMRAAGDARTIAEQLTQLEQSIDAIPAVIRMPLALMPSMWNGEQLVRHGSEASRVLATALSDIAGHGTSSPLETLHRHREALLLLRDRAHAIERNVAALATSILTPSDVVPLLRGAEGTFASTLNSIDQLINVADVIDRSVGWDEPRRYLLIFQNPNEMRATGGFLGSYGILEIDRGRVTSFTVPPEGSYGIKGNLAHALESPEPMRLINSRWQFQDSNWWPDWPTTAAKILWFWDASQQPSVDGVLAVNGTVFEDLLRMLGPVTVKNRGTIIAANTALETIETIITEERNNDNRRQPKRILGEIAAALQDRIARMTPDEQREVAVVLWSALQRREILVMSRIPEVQERIVAMKLDGSTQRSSRDYLMVVHSNIGGRKTDAVMENSTAYAVFIQPDGTAIATVTIERTHHGERGSPLTGAPNKDYIRFYVPEGSQFVDAWGFTVPPKEQFEIPLGALTTDKDLQRIERDRTRDARTGTDTYHENGKTVFGQWLWTKLGDRSSAGIRYVLPFRVAPSHGEAGVVARLVRSFRDDPPLVPYDLALVRQPGLDGTLAVTITTPPTWEAAWRYPMTTTTSPSTLQWSGDFNSDLWLGAVWKK